jgi:hypothetical protein
MAIGDKKKNGDLQSISRVSETEGRKFLSGEKQVFYISC